MNFEAELVVRRKIVIGNKVSECDMKFMKTN